MSFVRAAVFGRLREAMQAEVRAVAGGLRRAVAATVSMRSTNLCPASLQVPRLPFRHRTAGLIARALR